MCDDHYDYLFKILIIGDSGVGKSSLMNRFVDQNYSSEFNATIGVDFKVHTIKIDDKLIKLQIWDTAGQERFRTVTNTYYRGAHGVLVVYDTTNHYSFNNVTEWLSEIDRLANDEIPRVLVATKTDLTEEQMVTPEETQKLVQHYNLKHIETSSKNDQNVAKCFIELAQLMKNKMDLAIELKIQKPPYTFQPKKTIGSPQSSIFCCWQ